MPDSNYLLELIYERLGTLPESLGEALRKGRENNFTALPTVGSSGTPGQGVSGDPIREAQPPDRWRATENLLGAGSQFVAPLGQIAQVMRNVRALGDAMEKFGEAWKPIPPPPQPFVGPPAPLATLGAGNLAANIPQSGFPAPLAGLTPPPVPTPSAPMPTPPPLPDMARFFHGGVPYGEAPSPRDVTQYQDYAQGYADKGGSGKTLQYVDIPETHPILEGKKAFEEEGTGMKSPYINFTLPEELSRQLKPFVAEVGEGDKPPSLSPLGKDVPSGWENVRPLMGLSALPDTHGGREDMAGMLATGAGEGREGREDTELLNRAVDLLEELVGQSKGRDTGQLPPPEMAAGAKGEGHAMTRVAREVVEVGQTTKKTGPTGETVDKSIEYARLLGNVLKAAEVLA